MSDTARRPRPEPLVTKKTFRLSESLEARLERAAAAEDRDPSYVVRRLLDQHLPADDEQLPTAA